MFVIGFTVPIKFINGHVVGKQGNGGTEQVTSKHVFGVMLVV